MIYTFRSISFGTFKKPSPRIRFIYADHLIATAIFYVNKNPHNIATPNLSGCGQRLLAVFLDYFDVQRRIVSICK